MRNICEWVREVMECHGQANGDTWQFQRQVSCKRNGGTGSRKRWERIRIHGGMRVPFGNLTLLWKITMFNW